MAAKCSNLACNKTGDVCCPSCLELGVVFVVCSQDCLDYLWPDHYAKVHLVCSRKGCRQAGDQCCPVCLNENRVARFCSQPCFDASWPEHAKLHKTATTKDMYAPCASSTCSQPGTWRCPLCVEEKKPNFYTCSQRCFDQLWPAHLAECHALPCKAPGCGKKALLRCPLCLSNGQHFEVCSQQCMDASWSAHWAAAHAPSLGNTTMTLLPAVNSGPNLLAAAPPTVKPSS